MMHFVRGRGCQWALCKASRPRHGLRDSPALGKVFGGEIEGSHSAKLERT